MCASRVHITPTVTRNIDSVKTLRVVLGNSKLKSLSICGFILSGLMTVTHTHTH